MGIISIVNAPDAIPALTPDEVARVAALSRLALSPAQLEQYRAQLSGVLAHMDQLRALDLTGVEPLTNPLDAVNRMDDDKPRDPLPTRALMDMAPAAAPPFVKVPKVIGGGESA